LFIYSTGQVSASLLNLSNIRVDLMNKTIAPQLVRILFFNTSESPKTIEFDQTFSIPPSSGDFRIITPILSFPSQYEIVIRSNHPNIVPYISGITVTGSVDLNATFKYGDLFKWEVEGSV